MTACGEPVGLAVAVNCCDSLTSTVADDGETETLATTGVHVTPLPVKPVLHEQEMPVPEPEHDAFGSQPPFSVAQSAGLHVVPVPIQ